MDKRIIYKNTDGTIGIIIGGPIAILINCT